MKLNFLPLCLLALSGLTVHAQMPAPPTPRPVPEVVAGIPVNYYEAKVGTYTLPDPLKLNNGKPVRNAKIWYAKRRPEIEEIFATQQYGRDPGRPAGESFEVTDKGTPALNGKAIRKQIAMRFSEEKSWPKINLLIYLPAAARKPVPIFFSINFGAVQNAVNDPGIAPGEIWDPRTNTRIPAPKGRGFGRMNVEPFLDAGFAWQPSTTATSIPIILPVSPMASAHVISNLVRPNARQTTGAQLSLGVWHEPRGRLLRDRPEYRCKTRRDPRSLAAW